MINSNKHQYFKKKNNIKTIAEIGQAHDGSLGIAHSFIDSLKGTGVTAAKFQVHIADAESSLKEKFRKKFSYEDHTRYDYWKRVEFSAEEWLGIFKHCKKNNLSFVASPFSLKAVDLLDKIGCKIFKIGSGEVNNYLMIDKILKLKKEIILSSGLSNLKELDAIVKRIKKQKNKLSILQCTTEYPTKIENIGLNVISTLKKRYKVPAGLSDHSGNINTLLAASALGAEILEFHVTFDKKSFGPDSSSSIEIFKLKKLIEDISYINKCVTFEIDKSKVKINKKQKKNFSKSLSLNKTLKKYQKIKVEDLESKKPGGHGIDPKNYQKIIGKKLKKDLKKNSFLKFRDII